MLFTEPKDIEYIDDSATTSYPNNIAREIMKALRKEYRSKDRPSAVEAETELSSVLLGKTENPDRYFKRLGVVKSKWTRSKTITEEMFTAHPMATVLAIYLDGLTQILTIYGDAVTMDELKKALKLNWRLRHKDDDDDADTRKEGEVALSLNDVKICAVDVGNRAMKQKSPGPI